MTPEIVLLMGPPASGKSTKVREFVSQGYTRLNRDELGGSMASGGTVNQELLKAYGAGARSFVLDNTYATKEQRASVIDIGKSLNLPVRALVMGTTAEQAQFFAARRQVQRHGYLLREGDYKLPKHKGDANDFPPAAQFAYWNKKEDPTTAEGLVVVETVPVRIDLGYDYRNSAYIFDYDGTLRETISGEKYPRVHTDIRVLPGRADKLKLLKAQGHRLLGASNQSGCSKKPGDVKYISEADAAVCFAHTNKLLGLPGEIEVLFATDAAGVPKSFWRKPCPGMGLVFIEKYKLDPSKVTYVGDLGTDKTFAARCGFQFALADEFFR